MDSTKYVMHLHKFQAFKFRLPWTLNCFYIFFQNSEKRLQTSNRIKFFKNEAIKNCVQTNSADCLVKRYENDLLRVIFNQ